MGTSVIMIRVTPEEHDRWFGEHDSAEARAGRLEYGITDGPLYRDVTDPNVVLVQLEVEDPERARGWFQDERFAAAATRAGRVQREIIIGRRG